MDKYRHVPNMFAVGELGRFCSYFCEILNCMSKLWWCLATAATVPLFGETCEKRKGMKPQIAMTHSQSTWGHWHVLYVASRMVVGWESHLGTQLSHRDKRFIWSQLQMVVTCLFTPAPEVSSLLSLLHLLPGFPRLSSPALSSPNKSRAANSAQMWWWIIVSLCETAEMSPQRRWEQQQVGHAVGRHQGLHAVGTLCASFPVCERETRIQPPRREAKRCRQRGLKEARVHSSWCFFTCQTLQF